MNRILIVFFAGLFNIASASARDVYFLLGTPEAIQSAERTEGASQDTSAKLAKDLVVLFSKAAPESKLILLGVTLSESADLIRAATERLTPEDRVRGFFVLSANYYRDPSEYFVLFSGRTRNRLDLLGSGSKTDSAQLAQQVLLWMNAASTKLSDDFLVDFILTNGLSRGVSSKFRKNFLSALRSQAVSLKAPLKQLRVVLNHRNAINNREALTDAPTNEKIGFSDLIVQSMARPLGYLRPDISIFSIGLLEVLGFSRILLSDMNLVGKALLCYGLYCVGVKWMDRADQYNSKKVVVTTLKEDGTVEQTQTIAYKAIMQAISSDPGLCEAALGNE